MTLHLKYIGKEITLDVVKKFIYEYELGDNDKLILNPYDFNTVALEQIQSFDETIPIPFTILEVTIEKDAEKQIPYGSIGIP